jgi:uncharacterized protein (DUF427 family)
MKPESVWDYPRPPRLEPVAETIRIDFAGDTIAETHEALRVLETSHPPVYYLPRACFTCDLVVSTRTSFCEWKGVARYVTIRRRGREAVDCAWTYPEPDPGFAAIADHIAVYPRAMDACFVDGEQAMPQPGGFYGGWITSNLKGPFKGAPGSMGW